MKSNRVDYNKKFNDSSKNYKEETVIDEATTMENDSVISEDVDNEKESENKEILFKTKVNLHDKATHLSVRSNPAIGDNVIKTIPDGEEIAVFIEEEDGDWIKIVTASGVEGFVMKSFIDYE